MYGRRIQENRHIGFRKGLISNLNEKQHRRIEF
jgi:hypothetical protein